jgi:hypothetical protein
MQGSDPRDRWSLYGVGDGLGRRDPDDLDRLPRAAPAIAACLFLGSFRPPGSALATMASLLLIAAFADASDTLRQGEPMRRARAGRRPATKRPRTWASRFLTLAVLPRHAGRPSLPGMLAPVP